MTKFIDATTESVFKSAFLYIRNTQTQQISKVVAASDFQVGLSNVPRNLIVTGDLTSPATTFNLLNEPTTRTTNIATGAAAQTVTLGSTFVDSSLTLDGESFVALGAYGGPVIQIGSSNAGAVAIASAGSVTINATTINLGSTAVARTTNIATGAAAQTVTLGSTTGDSSLTLSAGIGNINIGTDGGARTTNIATTTVGTQTINIGTFSSNAAIIRIGNYGSTPTDSTTAIYGDTINIGTSGTATVTLGSTTASSSLTLQAGTGDIKIGTSSTAVKVGIGNSAPVSKLDVTTDEAGWAVSILNDGNNVSRFGLFIQNGSDTAAGTNFAVGIHDGDGTNVGYITFSGTTIAYGTFTGDHYAKITDLNTEKAYGIIVKIVNATTIPLGSKRVDYIVAQTTTTKDSAAFGVYSGNFENAPDESMKDYHSIFCLGDGHILVTDDGGNINIGDYICSSNKPGHGMAQDDDILHNYTVAKASAPVDFSNIPNDPIKGFKSVLVACTYHSA